jgi:hypothetical protein
VPVKAISRPVSKARRAAKTATPRRTARPGHERRRTPRVEILGEIAGESLTFDSPVTVLDLSPGGFSIETAVPLSIKDTHEFRFSVREGISVIVLARVVHRRPGTRRPGTYVFGLEFLDGSKKARADRAGLVERIVAGR